MQYTHGGDIYTYGEMIDFSVNINPLGPSKKVIEAAKRALLQSAAYPDCKCRKLREKLADRLRVDERMFAFGNGAAEPVSYTHLKEDGFGNFDHGDLQRKRENSGGVRTYGGISGSK